MFNPESVRANLLEMFHATTELIVIILLLITALIVCIIYHRKKIDNRNILFSIGMLLIILLHIVMVSKHYKNTYLAPVFSFYGLILFKLDIFFITILNKKWSVAIFPAITCILVFYAAKDTYTYSCAQKEQKEKREEDISSKTYPLLKFKQNYCLTIKVFLLSICKMYIPLAKLEKST